jgi:hypothetical protein
MRKHIVLLFFKLNHLIDLRWELLDELQSRMVIIVLKFFKKIVYPSTLDAQIEVTILTVPSLDIVRHMK